MAHSFKVAWVASRLAERLMSEEANVELVPRFDVDAVQAGALGDDLGHRRSATSPRRSSPTSCRAPMGPSAVAMRAGAPWRHKACGV